MGEDNITQHIARDVLGYYGMEGGWHPGGFTASLLAAFSRADSSNFTLLATVFPGYAEAMSLMRSVGGGHIELRKIAGDDAQAG